VALRYCTVCMWMRILHNITLQNNNNYFMILFSSITQVIWYQK